MTSTPAPVRLAFAFTDIEGSTRLLERLGAAYAGVLGDHAAIIRAAIARHGGREVDTQGDAFFAVFPDAADALRFGVDVQRGLAGHPWPDGVTVRVRIGLHAGEAIPTRTGYVGMDVHHGARVAAAAHGGQVLCSGALAAAVADTRAAMGDEGDDGPDLVPLGPFALKDIREPVELLQAAAPGLDADFPPPRTLDAPDEPPAVGDPPYPGLVPFDEADAGRFFGRDALVAELVERLGRDGFLAIVGASGSGKSSLLRAGLVPAVRSRLVAAGEPLPRVALLTPTEHPLAALDAALGTLDGPPHLVAVDQLEELATLARDEDERDAFVARLLSLHDGGTAVAVALRADLYAALAPHDRLRDLVAAHQAYPGPLAGDDLRAAIEGPAASGGWRLAPGLADLVIADLGTEPGSLPLLAHALRETWERRRGTLLGLRGYLDAGGVRGAIARSAERLADGLDDRELGAARSILLRLVRPGDEGPDTRRRAPAAELLGADPDPGLASAVLDRLVAARLVVVDGDAAEVAHEALIREWPRLRGWLDADRDALRLHRAVTDAAADHARAGDDPSLLWRGARLEAALAWLADHPSEATPAERAFLAASRAHEAAEAQEREDLRARELDAARRAADAERARADTQARSARRIRRAAIALVGLLVVAVGLGGLSVVQTQQADTARATAEIRRQEAETQARIALSRQLAAQSQAARADLDLSLLLALEAGRVDDTTEARGSLLGAVTAEPRLRTILARDLTASGLAFSPDGSTLVAQANEGGARSIPVTGDAPPLAFQPSDLADPASGEPPMSLTLSPDGRRLAVTRIAFGADESVTTEITVLDAADRRPIATSTLPGWMERLSFAPDGRTLTVSGEGGIMLWDPASDEAPVPLTWTDGTTERQAAPGIPGMTFSPDGGRAVARVTGDDPEQAGGPLVVWDVAERRQIGPPIDVADSMVAVAFSPDGQELVIVSPEGWARRWNVAAGAWLGETFDVPRPIDAVAYGRDGAVLALGGDRRITLVDTSTGEPLGEPLGLHRNAVIALAFAPDGHTLASSGFDGLVALWDIDRLQRVAAPMTTIDGEGSAIAVASTGDRMAVGTTNGRLLLLDPRSGETVAGPLDAHAEHVYSVAFDPSGRLLASAGRDGMVRRWDAASGDPLGGAMSGHEGRVYDVAFSPDGTVLASGGLDGTARLWSAADGAALGDPLVADTTAAIDGDEHAFALAFSPDGTRLAVSGAASTVIWDLGTRTQLRELPGHTNSVVDVVMSPDGSRIAAADADGAVLRWDAATGAPIGEPLRHEAMVEDVEFSPDGTTLAAVAGGAIILWDATTGQRLGDPIPAGDLAALAFEPGASTALSAGWDGAIRRWDLDEETWRRLACETAGRNLTPEEWSTYLGDEPWRETCPADGDAGA